MNKEFLIDTKVFTDVRTDGSGDLKGEAIESSIQGSLQRLKAAKGVRRQMKCCPLPFIAAIYHESSIHLA